MSETTSPAIVAEKTAQTRKVTTFSSGKNSRKMTIETSATTWGELMKDFDAAGIQYKNMSVVERKSKANLVLPDAALPKEDFLLYLLPEKTDSGALDAPVSQWAYKDIRGFIQAAIAQHKDAAKAHFNVGKNYTTKSSEELVQLIETFTLPTAYILQAVLVAPKKEKKSAAEKPAAPAVKEDNGVGQVVNAVAETAKAAAEKTTTQITQSTQTGQALTDRQKMERALSLVQDIPGSHSVTTAIKNWLNSEQEDSEDDLLAEEAASMSAALRARRR